MFEEPEESPDERSLNPADRAREMADECRMHAELFAVFEGGRKFDAQLKIGLDEQLTKEIQRGIVKLEKSRTPETPVIPPESAAAAAEMLKMPETRDLSTGDYHVHQKPGVVMIARWLDQEQVDKFYERLQAHFEAAFEGVLEDERSNEWKQDEKTQEYLKALDTHEAKMPERYLRDVIKTHRIFVLSTQAADDMNIAYLCDYVMGISPVELVGEESAPPDGAAEGELSWFFKLFALRGIVENKERMCFFAYLQKADDSGF